MGDYGNHTWDATGLRKPSPCEEHRCGRGRDATIALSPSNAHSLMRSAGIGGRGNSQARAGVMQAMQQTHGNRAVQRSMQANSSSAGRVSVQRTGITTAIPSMMDQARRAAAVAAASKPKEDQSGGWPELPDWLTPGGIGKAGGDLLDGMFGDSSTEEGWFEGSGINPTENTSPFPRPPTMPDSPTVQTDEPTFPWLNPEWPAPEGDFPWLNPEWPIPQEGPPTSEQPSAFPWLNSTGCF